MDYNGIDPLLNTTEGMEVIVNNVKNDDNTITLTGGDWFTYNGATISNLYVSGNSWIGMGASSEHLKVCRRDAALYYLYRQEGTLYNYYHFLKIRWEGYSYYGSTAADYALKYEFFIFDTGDMFLNVIQTPTNSSYIGTSQLVCGSNTYTLNIPINSAPMITFSHQNESGGAWAVLYEKIIINAPYDRLYLIQDGDGNSYTVVDGSLQQVEVAELSSQTFRDFGFTEKPAGSLLTPLKNPRLLYWQDSQNELPVLSAHITAVPPPQTICTETQDMSDLSISWIKNMKVDATENVLFAFAFIPDKWMVYNTDSGQWEEATEGTGMTKTQVEAITAEQWKQLAGESKLYWVRFMVPDETGTMNNIVVNYKNQEGIA